MSRSLKKGPYVDPGIIKKMQNMKAGQKTVIKTYKRASTVTPEMVGFTFGVHNGKTFVEVFITEDMVGHRLGEFSLTRKFTRHGGRMAREEEIAAAEAEKAKVAAAQTQAAPAAGEKK
jgi:small subunit ribosomal protein S19